MKLQIYTILVRSTSYGNKAWTIRENNEKKLISYEMHFIRMKISCTIKDHKIQYRDKRNSKEWSVILNHISNHYLFSKIVLKEVIIFSSTTNIWSPIASFTVSDNTSGQSWLPLSNIDWIRHMKINSKNYFTNVEN